MSTVSHPAILRAELGRLRRDRVMATCLTCALLACAALTAAAVAVAARADEAGSGPVSIQTTTRLDPGSTSDDLASYVASTLSLALPVLAVVLGTQLGARDLGNGALLTVSTTVRRLRPVLAVRLALVLTTCAVAALAATVVATVAAGAALPAQLTGLSAWPDFAPMVSGALVQILSLGALAFGLSLISRRATAVLLLLLLWILAVEPMVRSVSAEAARWLPVRATTAPLGHSVLPTVAIAAAVALVAVMVSSRERAYR